MAIYNDTYFLRTLIDEQPISQDGWLYEGTSLFIPKNSISKGDRILLAYETELTETNIGTFLSFNHKKHYKDLSLITELEFTRVLVGHDQHFQLLMRANVQFDQRFTADTYYAFGIKNNKFYLAKVSYYNESDRSFPYVVLLNLNPDPSGASQIFKNLSDDQIAKLQLSTTDDKLDYNKKYQLKATLLNNTASFYIRKAPPVLSVETKIDWIPLFENISLSQPKNMLSVRDITLQNIIRVPVGTTSDVLDTQGYFGFAVPNSFVRIFRFEVDPHDQIFDINLYTDEEYSRNVTPNFNFSFKTDDIIRLNSTNSVDTTHYKVIELKDQDPNSILIDKKMYGNITKSDILRIQIDGNEIKESIDYKNMFVDFKDSLLSTQVGNSIFAFIDQNETSVYGQQERYDTVSLSGSYNSFIINDSTYWKISKYPNGSLTDILLEVPADLTSVIDVFNTSIIGIKDSSIDTFVINDSILANYEGRKFFLEAYYRGEIKIFEMGYIEQGKYVFNIDAEYMKIIPSYEALWKYNLSNWIDNLSLALDTNYTNCIKSTSSPTFGYILAKSSIDLVTKVDSLLSTHKVYTSWDYSSLNYDASKYINIALAKEYNTPLENIQVLVKSLLYFSQPTFGNNFGLKNLILSSIQKDNSFVSNHTIYLGSVTFLDSDLQTKYKSFRTAWIEKAPLYRILSTQYRKYFISLNDSEYKINGNTISIIGNNFLDNRELRLRYHFDNFITLTDNYQLSDTHYEVPSNIKDLYTLSNSAIRPVELFSYLSLNTSKIVVNGNISYVIIPKTLSQNKKFYADVTLCLPYVDNSQPVSLKYKAPLTKVEDLLSFDFDSRLTGENFIQSYGISGSNKYNRPLDYINFNYETYIDSISGNKLFVNPTGTIPTTITPYAPPQVIPAYPITMTRETVELYLSENRPTITYDQWISEEIGRVGFWTALTSDLLWETALDELYLNYHLDILNWFNFDDVKIGSFYKHIIQNICQTKYLNRIIGDRSYGNDQYVLENWFDGFYTGERDKLTQLSSLSTPWGTQNSRYDIIQQVKNTLVDKFTNYDIFFVDLSEILDQYYDGTFQSNYVNSSMYPVQTNYEFIANPFVDPNISGYIPYNVVVDSDGTILTDETDFSIVNPNYDFTKSNLTYTNLDKISINISNIVHPITKNDVLWGFNSTIYFDNPLQTNTKLCAEYEYQKTACETTINAPKPILVKEVIGVSTGQKDQTYINPDSKNSSNIDYSQLHKIWIDGYITSDYNIENISTEYSKLVINDINLKGTPSISIAFNDDNLVKSTVTNTFVDDYKENRQLRWFTLTLGDFGYTKINSLYKGFITDTLHSKSIFRKSALSTVNGDVTVKVGGTIKSKGYLPGIYYGLPEENIIEVMQLRKRNNFEFKTDIYFEETMPLGLMETSIIFKGLFTDINGKMYLSDYYAIMLNTNDSPISLIQYAIVNGSQRSKILAKSMDVYNYKIQRKIYYTIKIKVLGNVVYVYLNEINEKEKLVFEYNIEVGRDGSSLMTIAEEITKDTSVFYDSPINYNIKGDRFGLITKTDKVYFLNTYVSFFEPNNLTFGDSFVFKSYDDEIEGLRTKYNLPESEYEIKKMSKTEDGVILLQIGNSLFSKRNGENWIIHTYNIIDFVVSKNLYYVQQYVDSVDKSFITIYKGLFEVEDSLFIDKASSAISLKDKTGYWVDKLESNFDNIFVTLKQ